MQPPQKLAGPLPEGSPPPVQIGVAVVHCAGRYLVGVRQPGVALAGCDEFPGGKCEPGETPEQCARRECREETGLQVTRAEPLLRTVHDYAHGRVELHFFLCGLETESPPAAAAPFTWIKASELATRNFPEANREVILQLTTGR